MGAVTMKMMSRTRITSTSGVTLIPVMGPSPWPLVCIGSSARLEPRYQQAIQRFRAGEYVLDLLLEIVISDDAGDRDEKTDGRGDQRLGKPSHHGLRPFRVRLGEIMKGLDHAEHRPEQADERGIVSQ